jgi:hypothetical protein
MKTIMKLTSLLLVMGLFFTLIGCSPRDDEDNGDDDVLSFENFPSASLLVKSYTGERLVAFKNTVSPATLISGIPAYADNHGLKKDTALFNSGGTFVLVLITEAQYNANKNNLAPLNDQAFAKLSAFYNSSSSPFLVTINSKLGGSGRLIVTNPTNYNVVLRSGYLPVETIGYIPAYSVNTAIPLVSPGSYEIYPAFTFFNTNILELFSVIAVTNEGVDAGKPFKWNVSLDAANPSMSVDVSTILDQAFVLTSGSAYLAINNNSTTAVRLFINSEPQTTSTGINLVNSGASVVYPLLFIRNPDASIKESQSFILQIGTAAIQHSVPEQEYELDYIYVIEVSGNASNLQLGTVTMIGQIDLSP